jgi:hypothetical protein
VSVSIRPDPGRLAVASLLVVAAFVGAATTVGTLAVSVLVVVGSVVAVVLSIPLAVLGVVYHGRYEVRPTLVRGAVAVVGAGVAAATLAAASGDPGDAPLVGAAVVALGAFWGVAPLSVGAWFCEWWRIPFRYVLVGWPPSLLLGSALLVVPNGLFPAGVTVVDALVGVAATVAVLAVVVVGPAAVGRAVARVRADGSQREASDWSQ